MKKFKKFETANIKRGGSFETLPKGAYVIKILKAEEYAKPGAGNSVTQIKIGFDVAEGEYKDFYKKQFDSNPNEDKKWPFDGVFYLSAPDDDSPQWMIDNFGTFIAALEDSNEGYHWDWDETKWKGLLLGALCRVEQSRDGDRIYTHTRPFWFRDAQSVRDGKYGKLPKDKLVEADPPKADDFMTIPMDAADECPF